MADRQGVIDAVLGYVKEDRRAEALSVIKALITPVVTSIGKERDWEYLKTTKDDYSYSDSFRAFALPSSSKNICYMGTLESGQITAQFYPITERKYVERGYTDSSFGSTHYMPTVYDADNKTQEFLLVGPITSAGTMRVVYYRKPSKNDLDLIDNELFVVMGILRVMPTNLLAEGQYGFEKIYSRELKKEISSDEASYELPDMFQVDPQVVAHNRMMESI